MTNITLEMIKQLRQKTHAGVLNCKKALEKAQGNLKEAIIILKKEGIAQALKKQNRITLEGLTGVAVHKNKAILFELNTETDFVCKNEFFVNLYQKIEKILLETDISFPTLNDFLNYHYNEQSIQDSILEATAIVQEKIHLKRIKIINKKNEESFGFYKHQEGKISALVHLSNTCAELEKNLPIHIAVCKPLFLSKETIDPAFVNSEEKMPLDKICLLEQPLYNNPQQKIKEYLKQFKTDIKSFYRLEVGK